MVRTAARYMHSSIHFGAVHRMRSWSARSWATAGMTAGREGRDESGIEFLERYSYATQALVSHYMV
jgi:hypothetical protein